MIAPAHPDAGPAGPTQLLCPQYAAEVLGRTVSDGLEASGARLGWLALWGIDQGTWWCSDGCSSRHVTCPTGTSSGSMCSVSDDLPTVQGLEIFRAAASYDAPFHRRAGAKACFR